MEEVDGEGFEGRVVGALEGRCVVGKFIERGFGGAPREGVAPVLCEPLDIGQRCTIVPRSGVELVGEFRIVEAGLEVVKGRVRDGDFERLDVV